MPDQKYFEKYDQKLERNNETFVGALGKVGIWCQLAVIVIFGAGNLTTNYVISVQKGITVTDTYVYTTVMLWVVAAVLTYIACAKEKQQV